MLERKERTPLPPSFNTWGWREKKAWKQKYWWDQDKRRRKKDLSMRAYMRGRILTLKSIPKKRWDASSFTDWLRIMTDKKLMGFCLASVKALNRAIQDLEDLQAVKTVSLQVAMRKVIEKEMKIIRAQLTPALVKKYYSNAHMMTHREFEYKGFKRVPDKPCVYVKDGVEYMRVSFMTPHEDYIRFKAILSMEGSNFTEWSRQRIRKYVTLRFKEVAKARNLVDPTIDAKIPDEEMMSLEGGDSYPKQKTENQEQAQEVTNLNNEEDMKAGE